MLDTRRARAEGLAPPEPDEAFAILKSACSALGHSVQE